MSDNDCSNRKRSRDNTNSADYLHRALPMKKRYEEVSRCRRAIEEILDRARTHLGLRFKQLYHDREEVTGYLAPDDGTSRRIGIRRPPR